MSDCGAILITKQKNQNTLFASREKISLVEIRLNSVLENPGISESPFKKFVLCAITIAESFCNLKCESFLYSKYLNMHFAEEFEMKTFIPDNQNPPFVVRLAKEN